MEWITAVFLIIEYLAVAIIAGMVFFSTARYLLFYILRRNQQDVNYRSYKHSLGAALLLGLEILVAADVIRTVALEPTLENIISLGLLVLVRTFLSWALMIELEGRWPWQPEQTIAKPGGQTE